MLGYYSPWSFIAQLRSTFAYLQSFEGVDFISSRPYEWLFGYKPIWYLLANEGAERIRAVLAFGNPVFWLSSLVFMVLGVFYSKKVGVVFWLLFVPIVLQLLFWAIKPTAHFYYMLTILPFYSLLCAGGINYLYLNCPRQRGAIRFNSILMIVFSFFHLAYYYPLVSGNPMSPENFKRYYPFPADKKFVPVLPGDFLEMPSKK
ncbi:MAG: hypothetical protein HQM15_11555 [Deltaproteobacteria bacterium]|nr:hypothetical protein [Deltaproteobacteria bacterium]